MPLSAMAFSILDFVKEKGPSKTSDIIQHFFEKSGEKVKSKFSQGIFTALTELYKSSKLKHDKGIVSLFNAEQK